MSLLFANTSTFRLAPPSTHWGFLKDNLIESSLIAVILGISVYFTMLLPWYFGGLLLLLNGYFCFNTYHSYQRFVILRLSLIPERNTINIQTITGWISYELIAVRERLPESIELRIKSKEKRRVGFRLSVPYSYKSIFIPERVFINQEDWRRFIIQLARFYVRD